MCSRRMEVGVGRFLIVLWPLKAGHLGFDKSRILKENLITVECLVTSGTCYHTAAPKAQGASWKRELKDCKGQRSGKIRATMSSGDERTATFMGS